MRKFLSVLFLTLLSVSVLAQTKTVKGFVYEEETGQPLPAATVSIAGSLRGVIADLDGAESIGPAHIAEAVQYRTYDLFSRGGDPGGNP